MTYDDQLELDLLVMLARDVAATPDSSDEAIAFFRHLAESFFVHEASLGRLADALPERRLFFALWCQEALWLRGGNFSSRASRR